MISDRLSAIDPEFPEGFRDLQDLWREFGPTKGRFIWNSPLEWIQQLEEVIETDPNISAIQLLKVREILKHLREEGYLLEAEVAEDESEWLKQVADAKQKGSEFEYVVSQSPKARDLGSISWPECLEQLSDPANQKHNWEIKGSIHEYRNALTPLILSANAIYFIDPYLNPLASPHGGLDLLQNILPLVRQAKKCKQIHIISENPDKDRTDDDYFQSLERGMKSEYESRLPGNCPLTWHILWDDRQTRKNESYFGTHDRHFLTNKGGLSFSKGFFLHPRKRDEAFEVFYLAKANFEKKYDRYARRLTQEAGTQPKIGNRNIERLKVIPRN